MIRFTATNGFDVPGVEGEIIRLRTLANDLERIVAGEAPTETELAEAPIIDRYYLGTRSVAALGGFISGHPVLPGDHRPARTSEVWAYAPEQGWARTWSRWYRLGRTPIEAAIERHNA